ncbi:hypothetical protein E2562_022268 [Oryza meyeriana var. granulata]|uniref:Uncharacterized protein n=1 Tax=Oryza meyeriana var. granulata TaxID=110450 RepID=A0A6G1D6T3_9ORYZ|nr:hypothetical protein E2562_022268 [Oryza meyeriana var. granulata]
MSTYPPNQRVPILHLLHKKSLLMAIPYGVIGRRRERPAWASASAGGAGDRMGMAPATGAGDGSGDGGCEALERRWHGQAGRLQQRKRQPRPWGLAAHVGSAGWRPRWRPSKPAAGNH